MNFKPFSVALIICLAAFSFAACASPEPEPEVEIETPETATAPDVVQELPEPAPALTETEQITTGELQMVDAAAGTLTLRDAAGIDQTFHFTETTEVVGAADVQGLSAQQGSQVTVSHTGTDDLKTAIRIEIVPR